MLPITHDVSRRLFARRDYAAIHNEDPVIASAYQLFHDDRIRILQGRFEGSAHLGWCGEVQRYAFTLIAIQWFHYYRRSEFDKSLKSLIRGADYAASRDGQAGSLQQLPGQLLIGNDINRN